MSSRGTLVRVSGAALVGALAVLAATASFSLPANASKKKVPVIRVRPSTGLRNRERVTVSGSHFPRKDTLIVIECNPKVLKRDSNACDLAGSKTITTSGKGAFALKFKIATGRVGDGKCGDSKKSATCYIFASEPSPTSKVDAYEKIHFALKKR